MTRTDRELIRLVLISAIVYATALVGLAGQINHPRGEATIECVISPTPQEDQEGYFPCVRAHIGPLSINVHPSGDLATFLRAKVGQVVKVHISTVR